MSKQNPITQTERHFHSRMDLAQSVTTRNKVDFPLNKLITAINLRFSFVVTVGGTAINYVAATNAALQFVKNIMFKTSGDGIAINAPAAALYYRAALLLGMLPRIDNASYDPAAEAAYTFSFSLPLLFCDPRMARPEDTILNMARYSGAELFITMGDGTEGSKVGVGSGGTFAISSATCDIELETIAGAPRPSMEPLFYQKVEIEGSPKNIASDSTATLNRSADKLLKRVMFYTANGASVSFPFGGVASALVAENVSFGDGRQYFDKSRYVAQITDENQTAYKVAAQTGLYVLDYVKDGSNFSAIPTGDKSELKLEWTAGASAPALVNTVSVLSDTLNKLK